MNLDKNNILSTDGLLILVDSGDSIVGYADIQKCHQGEGVLHRAFSIFLFNDENQPLIQQRSSMKPLWPLHWSNSVCSHPKKGESYEEATMRRLKEELGFVTSLKFLFKFQYQATFQNVGSENEMCSVFVGKADGAVQTDPNEIAQWEYVDLEQLNKDILAHPHHYTPWFKIEWERIQKNHAADIKRL